MGIPIDNNINIPNIKGETPLHTAAQGGDIGTAQLLISLGANINAQDNKGHTPLHLAIISKKSSMVDYLLVQDANIYLCDQKGHTSLHFAVQSGDFVTAQWLISHGANINARNNKGRTPVDIAISNSHFEIVLLLLQGGAHTDTALDKAITAFNDTDDKTSSLKVLNLLIESGIEVPEGALDRIKHEKYRDLAKQSKAAVYTKIRSFHKNLTMSANQVRCFLHIGFKVCCWAPFAHNLLMEFGKAITQMSIKDKSSEKLLRLEVNFRLLCYLEEALASYDPKYQSGSDIPKAFMSLIEVNDYTKQLLSMYQNFFGRYQEAQKNHTNKEHSNNSLDNNKIENYFEERQQSILFQEKERDWLFRSMMGEYPVEKVHHIFIQLWCEKIYKYVCKTFPADLRACLDVEHFKSSVFPHYCLSITSSNGLAPQSFFYQTVSLSGNIGSQLGYTSRLSYLAG